MPPSEEIWWGCCLPGLREGLQGSGRAGSDSRVTARKTERWLSGLMQRSVGSNPTLSAKFQPADLFEVTWSTGESINFLLKPIDKVISLL